MSNHMINQTEDAANSMVKQAGEKANALVQQGLDAARDTSHQMRESAQQATDRTVAYIRNEPIKAMLMAVGTGAALVMLARAFGTSNRTR